MAPPLLNYSFDALVFYPYCVRPFVCLCARVDPCHITAFNVLVKLWVLWCIWQRDANQVFVFNLLERWLDCLDGEVARHYNRCSRFGHLLDKTTDVVYRWTMAGLFMYMVHVLPVSLLIYWIVMAVSLYCPGVYIVDTLRGTVVDGEATARSSAIVLEDNATLLCFVVPLVVATFP